MKIKDMHTLYVESLRDLYSAETQLIAALPAVAQAATTKKLSKAVQSHLEETKGQKTRLEQIFKELKEKPDGHECAAMKGLIKETEDLIKEVQDKDVLDAALIGSSQKVEHYEIAGYGTARTYAQLLGFNDQANLLDQTLEEEAGCNEALNDLAESFVNERALDGGKGRPSATEGKTPAFAGAKGGGSSK